jgi:rSAM/selenodomain-associated transferase 2
VHGSRRPGRNCLRRSGVKDAVLMSISVVIPIWNDPVALRAVLATLAALRGLREVVVGDSSATDDCARTAAAFGARVVRAAKPGRGPQMNAAARLATGDVLLFQHADTELRQAHLDSLVVAMGDPDVAGGAFHRKFDARHPRLMWLEGVTRSLAEHGGTLYGDQSLFVRRDVFERMGGYREFRLMEDVDLSRRLLREGRRVVLDPPIATSARTHARRGSWRTSLRNGLLLLLYRAGAPPDFLHAWYYRK